MDFVQSPSMPQTERDSGLNSVNFKSKNRWSLGVRPRVWRPRSPGAPTPTWADDSAFLRGPFFPAPLEMRLPLCCHMKRLRTRQSLPPKHWAKAFRECLRGRQERAGARGLGDWEAAGRLQVGSRAQSRAEIPKDEPAGSTVGV